MSLLHRLLQVLEAVDAGALDAAVLDAVGALDAVVVDAEVLVVIVARRTSAVVASVVAC